MKNARPQNAETSAIEQRHFNPSALSPRQSRIVHALLARPRPRIHAVIVRLALWGVLPVKLADWLIHRGGPGHV